MLKLGGEGLLGLLLMYCLMNGKSYRSRLLPALKYFVPFCAGAVLVGADVVAVFLWQKRWFECLRWEVRSCCSEALDSLVKCLLRR